MDFELQRKIDAEINKITEGYGFVAPELMASWLRDKIRNLAGHIVAWKAEAATGFVVDSDLGPLKAYNASCGPVTYLVAASDLPQAWAVFTKAAQEGGVSKEDFEDERTIIWALSKSDWATTMIQEEGKDGESVAQSMEKITAPGVLGSSDF